MLPSKKHVSPAVVVAVVAAVIVVVVVVDSVRWFALGGERDYACSKLYDDRTSHAKSDKAFWEDLQDCAREGRLPEGKK